MDHLALQIGGIHLVKIHQADAPNPGGSQVKRDGGAKPTRSDQQNGSLLELALPIEAYFRQNQVARIAKYFIL